MTESHQIDLAWHFVSDTLRDGRPVPPDGEWLHHDGEIRMCRSGLHASRRALNALAYAPGPTVCRVAVMGVHDEDADDKLVARSRAILWRLCDSDAPFRQFARECALSVIDLWDAQEMVQEYLETGDEKLRDAARAAAWAAERDAARAAARAAAWGAKFNELNTALEAKIHKAAGNPDEAALLEALE